LLGVAEADIVAFKDDVEDLDVAEGVVAFDGGPYLYICSREAPPQYCKEFPLQVIVQPEDVGLLPFSTTNPHQPVIFVNTGLAQGAK
jgi:hypothetical protein